jgi:hypothetical protein
MEFIALVRFKVTIPTFPSFWYNTVSSSIDFPPVDFNYITGFWDGKRKMAWEARVYIHWRKGTEYFL